MTPVAWTVRPAVAADVAALVELSRRSWLAAFAQVAPYPLVAWWVREDRARALVERHWPDMLVAADGDAVAGLVQPAGAEVSGLWVHPARHGQGAGAALLAAAEAGIRRAGHPVAWLTCAAGNAPALAFYRRRGVSVDRSNSLPHPSGVDADDGRAVAAAPRADPTRDGPGQPGWPSGST